MLKTSKEGTKQRRVANALTGGTHRFLGVELYVVSLNLSVPTEKG